MYLPIQSYNDVCSTMTTTRDYLKGGKYHCNLWHAWHATTWDHMRSGCMYDASHASHAATWGHMRSSGMYDAWCASHVATWGHMRSSCMYHAWCASHAASQVVLGGGHSRTNIIIWLYWYYCFSCQLEGQCQFGPPLMVPWGAGISACLILHAHYVPSHATNSCGPLCDFFFFNILPHYCCYLSYHFHTPCP